MDSIQLLPATLQTEYMTYTMDSTENNGQGAWPFYSQSSDITIQKPVFFQRSKVDEESSGEPVSSTDMSMADMTSVVAPNYKARPFVLVSDLDEIYELAQTAGEIAVGDSIEFDCVGIIQHAFPVNIGYKFVNNYGTSNGGSSHHALIENIQSADPNLSSWADFVGFIQSLKTVFHMTTLDMMACALYSNPDWRYIIDLLAVRENITIRASLDNTGTVLDEGNWILETNDIDLTDIYFTDKIYEWKYVLTTYIDNRFYALRWNNVMYATRSYDARLKIAAGTNNFTIEAWYYETSAQTNATVVDMGDYNYTFQIRTIGGGGLNLYNYSTGWLSATSATITPGQWNHVAITRSGSLFTFYVNGIARQTITNSSSLYSNNSTFAIGWQSPDTCLCNRQKTDSALYDLRLWNVARTATEIQMNRNRIVPANTTGLVANYLLTDNSGTLNDRTANGLHTTIQSYTAARWSNSTVPIPNIGFLINNGYSLRTGPSGGSLNAIGTFDDITYTDFSGVDLSGVNFANADLTGSNFTNANLTNANLSYAVTVGATFTEAITTGSSISLAITSPMNVLQLDGIDDAVNLGVPEWSYSTQFRRTMTVECWFKTTDTANQRANSSLVSRWFGGADTRMFNILMTSTGTINAWLVSSGGVFISTGSTTTYKDTLWHHVAMTYNSATGILLLYIDGVLNGSTTSASFGELAYNTATRLVFGSDDAGITSHTDRQFRGFLSDIRVWNVVRSASDISNNMRQRLVGNETGLMGYWKLHQGYGTGWATYTRALDSTINRVHGTLTNMGTPSSNWVLSTGSLSFQPRISAITLGPGAGAYSLADNSFSFIDPSSNSLGNFTYAVSPGTVATVANGASTRKTVYATSGAIAIPTLSTFEFPELASLTDWQIDISFTQTSGAGSWRALIGDYQNEVNTRGWGLWVSSSNRIHWSWSVATAEPIAISVSLNTPYVLTVAQSGGTITLTLRAVSTGVTQTDSFSVGANIMGKGPVTIGGWRNSATENFTGTISYVNVSVPTVERVVTLLSMTGATPATLTATQEGLVGMSAGTKTASFTVSPIAPTISTWSITGVSFGVAPFTLTRPSSNSSGAFAYTSLNTAVATVSGNTVTVIGAGTATIRATQEASGNYLGGVVDASLVVSTALSNFTVGPKVYGDDPYDLTNPTSFYTNEPFIFTIVGDTTVATLSGINGRTVTILKAGETTIKATQVATQEHAELNITATLVVAKRMPIITLGSITKTYGDASFNLAPSSTNTDNNGLGGVFTFTSSEPNVASIFDTSYVSITGVGGATITITQSATTNFTDASNTVMLTVNKATPVLSTLTVSSTRTYGSAPFSISTFPTSISNGAITYSSSDVNVATIDNSGVITLVASGFVTFIARQASTALYNEATKASNTMTVQRQIQLLQRSSPTDAVINKVYGDSYFIVSATNSSNGGVTTYETDNPSVAGVINATNGVISVVSLGTAIITARRTETAQYTFIPVSWTVHVGRANATLSGLTDLSYNVTAAPFTVYASSLSDGPVTYSLQDPSSNVLTIDTSNGYGVVTLKTPGTAVIVASQASGTFYQTPSSITATITVSSAGNVLQGATITNTTSFASVNLSGANLTNAVITSTNFAGAELSGAIFSGATITGATFTSVSLTNADLSGATLTSSVFTGSDLSGARLTGVNASGASFANARLNNADLTGANVENVNFTNTSIKGANITDVSFSPLQKLQLLKNSDNRDIGQIIIPEVTGTTILAAISTTSPLRAIPNLDLTSASVTVAVVIPQTSTSPTDILPDVSLNVQDSDKFYLPINTGEYFQIDGVKYYTSNGVVRNNATNDVVEVITYDGKSVWLLAGSVVGLVLQTNTLNTSSFVVPSHILNTNTAPFMPTTLPTSNSDSPIVYSSSNTNVATIDPSSGLITPTGNIGSVRFTATQVQNATYAPGSRMSNIMVADRSVNFSLTGLNQAFNLSTLATLDASSINPDTTDATAVFYLRVSDMINVFKYQTDAYDVNNTDASDVKYYVFHRKWPAELKINPSHAMMNKAESRGMLGLGDGFASDKSLMKHDFLRYIALRLFNTIHGVDLFHNESDLRENMTYFGETVRHNIDNILSGISTTSASETMSYDASGNKYLTNDSSGNTNLCRELMRQVAASAPDRFYNNGGDVPGLRSVPFLENDTILFKVIVQAAPTQNVLTGVSEIPSRSYTIKLVLKNTVTSSDNTEITDSEMYPNTRPYSSSVTTYAATADSSGVYNIYSPPAPIPFSRFGYNGWYYKNSSAWVNVAPTVRNHIKWLVTANTAGSSTVADLQYIRLNVKIHNNASLPYLMIYTQAGSLRKYAVNGGGNGSLTNGTMYSMFVNFNSYLDEPAMVGYTNAALVNTIGSGSFANNEIITSIAIETDSNAAAGNVEFTLASMIVGERSTTTGLISEKEYGFEADVPVAYP
jgi:uncharacterized protein YjbI with pentapeptide repeats